MHGGLAAQLKEFSLDGLKKLEQRSHKSVELGGGGTCKYTFFNPLPCCFPYKAKDLSGGRAGPPAPGEPGGGWRGGV
jgi:hypothetical protein